MHTKTLICVKVFFVLFWFFFVSREMQKNGLTEELFKIFAVLTNTVSSTHPADCMTLGNFRK